MQGKGVTAETHQELKRTDVAALFVIKRVFRRWRGLSALAKPVAPLEFAASLAPHSAQDRANVAATTSTDIPSSSFTSCKYELATAASAETAASVAAASPLGTKAFTKPTAAAAAAAAAAVVLYSSRGSEAWNSAAAHECYELLRDVVQREPCMPTEVAVWRLLARKAAYHASHSPSFPRPPITDRDRHYDCNWSTSSDHASTACPTGTSRLPLCKLGVPSRDTPVTLLTAELEIDRLGAIRECYRRMWRRVSDSDALSGDMHLLSFLAQRAADSESSQALDAWVAAWLRAPVPAELSPALDPNAPSIEQPDSSDSEPSILLGILGEHKFRAPLPRRWASGQDLTCFTNRVADAKYEIRRLLNAWDTQVRYDLELRTQSRNDSKRMRLRQMRALYERVAATPEVTYNRQFSRVLWVKLAQLEDTAGGYSRESDREVDRQLDPSNWVPRVRELVFPNWETDHGDLD